MLPISEHYIEYAREVDAMLCEAGVRSEVDTRNEKIGYKIREHTLQKVPYLLVVGDRENEQGLITLRTRAGEDLGQMTTAAFVERLRAEK